tara:strand:+ start:57 stop:1349 length:1293 start_codon:yes stop_codon:yes gene_type:complete
MARGLSAVVALLLAAAVSASSVADTAGLSKDIAPSSILGNPAIASAPTVEGADRSAALASPVCDGDSCSLPSASPMPAISGGDDLAALTGGRSAALDAFCTRFESLLESYDGGKHNGCWSGAAKLLSLVCENVVAQPAEDKFRTLHMSNAAVQKQIPELAQQEAAAACLSAVGFELTKPAEPTDPAVASTATAPTLILHEDPNFSDLAAAAAHMRRALRVRDFRAKWPAELFEVIPECCAALDAEPRHAESSATLTSNELLEKLSEELSAPHVPALLAQGDNAQRVAASLRNGRVAAEVLLTQLVEIRQNSTAMGSGAEGGAGGSGLVVAIKSNEQWYDLLMAAKGLVVVDFGAKWCGPCQHASVFFSASVHRVEGVVCALYVCCMRLVLGFPFSLLPSVCLSLDCSNLAGEASLCRALDRVSVGYICGR